MTVAATRQAIEAVWRIEAARVIAGVARLTRDLGLAEDFAQDALLAALEHWPEDGIPDNPGAWLMTTAKRRALDLLRRNSLLERKHQELAHELDAQHAMAQADFQEAVDTALDDDIGDNLLRLIFTACHPLSWNSTVLSPWRWPSDLPPVWKSSMRWRQNLH